MIIFKLSQKLVALSFATWITCLNVFAYIPPSQFILGKWVKQHSGVQRIRVRTTVTQFENGKSTGVEFKETTQYNLDTGSMISWVSDPHSDHPAHKLFVVDRKMADISLGTKVLFGLNLKDLTQALKDQSIPIKTKEDLAAAKTEAEKNRLELLSLARLDQKIAWVIGSQSQLWIEKDSFLPLRILSTCSKSSEICDIQFMNYRFSNEVPFPSVLTVSKKGESPFLSVQMDEIKVNPEPIKAEIGKYMTSGFTAAGDLASEPIKNLIRSYYDIVR